jgi:two-component system LytT family response regulator
MDVPFKISAIVIDDEKPAREEMIDLLGAYKDIEIVAVCKNAFEANFEIEKLHPEVIFLDISMPEKNGFDLLSELKIIPITVFVTAYDEFAIKAFEENALDYLLKPILSDRLDRTIQRLRQLIGSQKPFENPLFRNLFIRDRSNYFIIKLHEVFLIESYGNYIKIHFGKDRSVLQSHTLKEALVYLPKPAFIRINHNQIINIEFVDKIAVATSRRLEIRLKNRRDIFVASTRKSVMIRELLRNKL